MTKIILLLIIIPISLCAQENQNNDTSSGGIVYGENFAFFVKAPDGWILDNNSGVSQGLDAVFYPKGSSWDTAITVMYANGTDIDSTENLENFIKDDIETFHKNHPGIKTVKLDSIIIGKNARVAEIIKFYGGSYINYESVAYIKEKKNVSIIVMSSRKEKQFEINYPKFVELVKSYLYIGDNVTIQN